MQEKNFHCRRLLKGTFDSGIITIINYILSAYAGKELSRLGLLCWEIQFTKFYFTNNKLTFTVTAS